MGTTLNSTIAQEKNYNFSLSIFFGNNKDFFMVQKYINQNLFQRLYVEEKKEIVKNIM